jgi:IclR family transcriptional regulator, mhp operon transcriptional activator
MARRPDGEIRSVRRALALLRLLNQREVWDLHSLHECAEMPKPTVYRLLSTLRKAGYVQSDRGTGEYRLAERVQELASGYTEKSLLVEIGAPVALSVTRRIRWPLALGTLSEDVIVVRYSTMPESPLAVQTTTLGHRLGLLESAMGFAYLAFCPASEYEILISLLSEASPRRAAIDVSWIAAQVELTRRRGYGLRLPQAGSHSSATLAVPIKHREEVMGILSMTTFGRAMTKTTIACHEPVLRETAATISTRLAEHIEGQQARISKR